MSAIQQRLKAIQLRQADANIVGHGGAGCGGALVGSRHRRGGAIVGGIGSHHTRKFYETHPNYMGGAHHTKKFYATHPNYHMGGAIVGGRAPNAWDQFVHQHYDEEYMHDYMPNRTAKQNRSITMHDLSQMYRSPMHHGYPTEPYMAVESGGRRTYVRRTPEEQAMRAEEIANLKKLIELSSSAAQMPIEGEAPSQIYSLKSGRPLSSYQRFVVHMRPIIIDQYDKDIDAGIAETSFPLLAEASKRGTKRDFNNALLSTIAMYWDQYKMNYLAAYPNARKIPPITGSGRRKGRHMMM